ncbi:MAG: 50S ribosomal protein L29 [Candidatus Doudnabacteria bacterium]
MKFKELKTMNRAEQVRQLATMREQLRDLAFKLHSREVKNTHSLKVVKRDIARILTLINEQ